MKTIFFAAVAFVLAVSGMSVAYAQGNAGSGAGASGSLQVGAQVGTTSEVRGNVETEWKVEKGEKAEEGESGDTTEDSRGSEIQSNAVSASAVEVRGWDAEQKREFLATVKAHAQVQSGQDLENFATGVLLRDENVEVAAASDTEVEVAYRMPAKFVGIFNASLAARAEVDAEGRVKVSYPWFGFLFAKTVSAAELEAEIEAALPEVGDEVLVGFEAQAEVLLVVSNALKARHDTAMAAIQNTR